MKRIKNKIEALEKGKLKKNIKIIMCLSLLVIVIGLYFLREHLEYLSNV